MGNYDHWKSTDPRDRSEGWPEEYDDQIEQIDRLLSEHSVLVQALRDANAFILAPAEDLKEGVLSRIRAALLNAGGR